MSTNDYSAMTPAQRKAACKAYAMTARLGVNWLPMSEYRKLCACNTPTMAAVIAAASDGGIEFQGGNVLYAYRTEHIGEARGDDWYGDVPGYMLSTYPMVRKVNPYTGEMAWMAAE